MHRDIVEGKDVDEDALVVWHVLLVLAQERRPFAAKLAVAPSKAGRVRVILEVEAARVKFRRASLAESFILGPQQRDVRVIVPRDEPSMPHRAQERAGDNVVMDAAFFADTVGFNEELELDALELAQLCLREMDHAMDAPFLNDVRFVIVSKRFSSKELPSKGFTSHIISHSKG